MDAKPSISPEPPLQQHAEQLTGIILAGGQGTRLRPLTDHTNKHLLPIADHAMIRYPIQALVNINIKRIIIVTAAEYVPAFESELQDLRESQHIEQLIILPQLEPAGIANALLQAADHVPRRSCVMLGDQLIGSNLQSAARTYLAQSDGAMVLTQTVSDPSRFGVAEIVNDKIIAIEEKPAQPKSNLAVAGIYFYDQNVFDYCRDTQRSVRGEFEITDVNTRYIKADKMTHHPLKGWWADVGTFQSLDYAKQMVTQYGANQLKAQS